MAMTSANRRRWLQGAAGAVLLAGAGLTWMALGHMHGGSTAHTQEALPARDTPDADYAALETQLRRQPRDARAWVLKARADMTAGRHELAAQAYAKGLEVGRKVAMDANVWVEYAEARGLVQGGRLVGEPRALLDRALALSPLHPQALDLAGSAAWQAEDFEAAARFWQRLQQQLPADDPRQPALQRAVDTAQRRTRLALPIGATPVQNSAPAPAAKAGDLP